MPNDKEMRRAVVLGLRPDGQRQLKEAFALLRGLTIDAIARSRDASGGSDPCTAAADLYHAAYQVYLRICADLQVALAGELGRFELLEKRMKAAGLEVKPPGPVERWRAAWEAAGLCAISPGGIVQQQILSRQPTLLGARGIHAARHALRPDMAPPPVLPAGTLVAYVTGESAPGPPSWAFVTASGGDCLDDEGAHLCEKVVPLSR